MAKNKVLAISWLHGKFRAIYLNKGEVRSVWESPSPVDENIDFTTVLNEAVNQTGYDGVNVAMVLGTRRLIHHLVEVPPVTGSDLDYYVERRANQLKTFDEPAAFSYTKTPPTKISNAIVVHILPKPFLEKLISACHELDLHMTRLFPVPVIMQTQLPKIQSLEEEIVALVSELEGTTNLLIAKKNGEVFFGRTIYRTWRDDAEYVGTEIMRSILFVKQQFGVMATRIFLFGEKAADFIGIMQHVTGLPVEVVEKPASSQEWLLEMLKLPEDCTDNLISPDLRQEPQVKLLIKMVGFLVILIIAIVGGWVAFTEKQVRSQKIAYEKLLPRRATLEKKYQEIKQREIEIEHRNQVIKLVTDNPSNPVPGWFLGYLCDIMPDDLVLHELHISRSNNLWYVRIAGSVQPVGDKKIETAKYLAMQVLQNKLEKSPFHLKVTRKSPDVEPAPATAATQQPEQISDTAKDISSGLAMRREAGISMLGDALTNSTKSTGLPGFIEKTTLAEKAKFWLEGVMQ